jgi:S1-C subfamily serine protease
MTRHWLGNDRMERNEVGPTHNPSLHQRTVAGSGIRGGCASFSRLIARWTIAGCWLIAGIVFAGSATADTAGQTASEQGLGSAQDYVQSYQDSYVRSYPDFVDTFESPLLGIAVKSGASWLERGSQVTGVEILTVAPGSPGATAGLQGSGPGVVHTTALLLGMLAAAAFFPPAMIGVMTLSGIGQAHETIIAVDGERTRDVTGFEEAIEKAEAGEVVYLTVVSGGRREQIRVALPVQ